MDQKQLVYDNASDKYIKLSGDYELQTTIFSDDKQNEKAR